MLHPWCDDNLADEHWSLSGLQRMTLNEMRQALEADRIQLTKSLGQNFLHDANQLRRIADAAELKATDRVVEIGPGLGPLTELLVAQTDHVLAIEKDRRLVEFLRRRFGKTRNLELVHDDALEFLRRESRDWSDWKLMSNLPYSVASPILVELAEANLPPQRMVTTLQLEVAQRLMAAPDAKDYGVLTLLVQLRYEPGDWFKIPASCFFPKPAVDSACVVLNRRKRALLNQDENAPFTRVIKRGFSQRRKMMFKLLKEEWREDQLAAAFTRAAIDVRARAEGVRLEQFVTLTRELAGRPQIPSTLSAMKSFKQGET